MLQEIVSATITSGEFRLQSITNHVSFFRPWNILPLTAPFPYFARTGSPHLSREELIALLVTDIRQIRLLFKECQSCYEILYKRQAYAE